MNEHTMERMNMRKPAGVLVLADGSVFEGELIGAPQSDVSVPASGEVVFNTALSGYQEILTDPSYAGQIITFTNPHIGNYGVNATDFESRRLFCRGVVVRELARRPSNRNSQGDLDSMLRRYGVPGIAGIDTRRLTRVIRDTGAIPGAIGPADDVDAVRTAAADEPGTDGIDLVAEVTTPEPYTVGAGSALPGRRLRLRHQAHDPAPPRRTGLGRRRPGGHARERRGRPRPGRDLPLERPGRPGLRRVGAGDPRRAARFRDPDLRHLPGQPAARAGTRWATP